MPRPPKRRDPAPLARALCAVVMAMAAATAAAQDAAPSPIADAETIRELTRRIREIGDPRLPEAGSSAIGENVPELSQALERQEALARFFEQHAEPMRQLEARYAPGATDPTAIRQTMNARFTESGLDEDVGDLYGEILSRRAHLEQAPAVNARRCVFILRQRADLERLRGLADVLRPRAIVEGRALLDLCPRIAPNGSVQEQQIELLRPRVEAAMTEFREEIVASLEARQWEGGVGPAALAHAALEFLRGHAEWGGNTARGTQVLAVSVTGSWFSAERNLLGQTTKWGLPVQVAITTSDAPEGVAQVFELSVITPSSAQRAPFEGYWVGETWCILSERVPGVGGGRSTTARASARTEGRRARR